MTKCRNCENEALDGSPFCSHACVEMWFHAQMMEAFARFINSLMDDVINEAVKQERNEVKEQEKKCLH